MRFISPLRLSALLIGIFLVTSGACSARAGEQPWLDLLKQQKFEALEVELQKLQTTFVEGECAECLANAPYVKFATSDPLIGQRLDEWVAAHPDSAPAHLARGRYLNHIAWLARGTGTTSQTRPEQFAEMERLQTAAVQDLLWTVQHEPRSPLAFADLIYISTAQRGEIAAAQIYDSALQANPDSPAIYRARVWSLSPWWQGVLPWSEAMARQRTYIADLQQKYSGRPGFEWLDGYADYMEAEAYLRTGDMDAAIASYTRALSARERTPYLLARAEAYANLKKLELRDADMKRALELSPDDEDALFENGRLNSRICRKAHSDGTDATGVCKAAIEQLNAAVAADPLAPKPLLYRGLLLAAVGQHEDARRDLHNADVYGKFDAWTQDMMASIYRIFDHDAAKVAFQNAIALGPNDPYWVEHYLLFLAQTADCDFLKVQASYRERCAQSTRCQMVADLDDMAESFQQTRRQSCAGKDWQQPETSLAMPE